MLFQPQQAWNGPGGARGQVHAQGVVKASVVLHQPPCLVGSPAVLPADGAHQGPVVLVDEDVRPYLPGQPDCKNL
ncbi:hypothetical protein SDC9_184809 [bioreactor metagenome]|uniref:Uncharacterized protein n=1 Tax=bioreactor metagenome TaxID=1076179 RepID=A0A645HPJ8_9ZZZZ